MRPSRNFIPYYYTHIKKITARYRDILAEAGLPADYAPRLHRFMSAIRDLDKVRNNQLLLLHERGAPDEEVIAYGMEHGLNTEDLEKQLMRFYRDPLWRSYGFNYSLGRNLVEAFLSASAGRLEAFSRLLESPMTPEQLSSAAKQ